MKDIWYPVSLKGSHVKLKHDSKPGTIVFHKHGNQIMYKDMENKLMKDAGLK